MEQKGLVKWILFALLAVCLIQLVFHFPTMRVEREAEEVAQAAGAGITDESQRYNAEKLARIHYLDSISGEKILKIPLLKDYTYTDLKKQQLALGLDLKGGMSSVLQIDLKDFLMSLSGQSKDPIFTQALANADAQLVNSQSDYITLFVQEFKKIANGKTLASIFSKSATLKDRINFESSDNDVQRVIRQMADETVDLTFKRIKDRIDKFGATQPNVSLDKARDMIVVELPGVDNPERARKYLQASAKLEFWEVYRISDPGVFNAFVEADAKLKSLTSGDTTSSKDKKYRLQNRYDYTRDSLGNVLDSSLAGVDTIPDIADPNREAGPLFKVFSPNQSNGQGFAFSEAVLGVTDKANKEKVLEMLNKPEIKGLFPVDLDFRVAQKPAKNYQTKEITNIYDIYGIKKKINSNDPPLDGSRVTRSMATSDPVSGQIVVSLTMDNKGAKAWGDLTTRAANDRNREVAIALDDEIVSCPRVINPILGGNTQISGSFNVDEAKDLANILQVGKLPAKAKIVQESLVGPSLGKENISKSLWSILGGFFLVMIFMVVYYTAGGFVSIIALALNIIFILASLASFGTVLTLPGIAGVVLTMGMAVDANIIIYERIKEELAAGRTLLLAISEGFKHSLSAIIDSHVTALLSSIVLFYYGLGPVKGFALVLIIGIIFSVFTSVLVSRLIIDWWTSKGRPMSFASDFTARLFKDINFDWVGNRKYAYMFSGILTLIGLVSFFTRGFELGVEFKGGYSINVHFENDVDAEKLRNSLTTSFGATPIVKSVDTKNTYNITTSYLINDNSQDVNEKVKAKLLEGINAATGANVNYTDFNNHEGDGTHILSYSQVGPVIADDIKNSSTKAIILSLVVIFIYILIRFYKWQYSAGAIIALAHDTLVVLTFFSLFHGIFPFAMEIDQAFIAAILTVIGYSMNDTVIVFDRIKEYLAMDSNKSDKELINAAINTTLSRTINTSLVTLLTIVILFFFGGSSIKGFAFALMIGIAIGTYSSIFVATPVIVDFAKNLRINPKKTSETKGKAVAKTA
ncbi:MAG TPA: protein translocase subunit SecDF [Saprospiraceae bacterium]|nr:protein translocase subunit SecDF [Saprospiraceae bacterium]